VYWDTFDGVKDATAAERERVGVGKAEAIGVMVRIAKALFHQVSQGALPPGDVGVQWACSGCSGCAVGAVGVQWVQWACSG
jgi:hypothetical protein